MHRTSRLLVTAMVALFASSAAAQRTVGQITRIDQGVSISVRTDEAVQMARQDNRIYRAIVDRDVRDSRGNVTVPRGSAVELVTRVGADGNFDLALANVRINGYRYVVKADPDRAQGRQDESLARAAVGSVNGSRGNEVPAGTEITFHLDRPMVLSVPDPGEPSVRKITGG